MKSVKRHIVSLLFVLFPFSGEIICQTEWDMAIQHFQAQDDQEKFQALFFLLNSMDQHYSNDYGWMDSNGIPLLFNECDYPDMESSLNAFNLLKKDTDITGKTFQYRDRDTLTSERLIENIELAFKVWKQPWNSHLSFDEFCEYILPYRVWTEPLQDWRQKYHDRFMPLLNGMENSNLHEIYSAVTLSLSDFVCTYGLEKRQDPISILGPLNLLHRKQGDCLEVAVYTAYVMRSIGLPCCVDFCPFWATSSGRHYWNVTFDRNKRPVPFAGAGKNFDAITLPREVGKAYRVTYQKQPDALASIAPSREIPPGYLRSPYLKDVTSEYGDVSDVRVSADFLPDRDNVKYAFAAVFNYSKWGVIAWTPIEKEENESSATFRNMQRGCVYLPMSYYKGKTQSLSHPFSIDSAGRIEHLAPDSIHKRDVTLHQQDGYLIYRSGKKYTLFYWDRQWKEATTKVYQGDDMKLVFENVPDKTLLLLRPEYSEGKERVFTVDDDGVRHWW